MASDLSFMWFDFVDWLQRITEIDEHHLDRGYENIEYKSFGRTSEEQYKL